MTFFLFFPSFYFCRISPRTRQSAAAAQDRAPQQEKPASTYAKKKEKRTQIITSRLRLRRRRTFQVQFTFGFSAMTECERFPEKRTVWKLASMYMHRNPRELLRRYNIPASEKDGEARAVSRAHSSGRRSRPVDRCHSRASVSPSGLSW